MDQRQKWLNDLRAYEISIRNKQAKEICNKKDIEKMRFALRVLLDDALCPTKDAPAGESATSDNVSTPAPAQVI